MPSTSDAISGEPKEISIQQIYENKAVLAFIIDDEVVDVFYADERFAAIIQSSPKIIELKNESDPMLNGPHIGWKYDGSNFYFPSIDNEV